ncbi:hypothetical protein LSAT2_008029 [Lamellibrachia satsuma]|nr:hypothetical protein LSAT2_008029 [Lamellibrachia satsuma]
MWLPKKACHGSRGKGNSRLSWLLHLGILLLCIQCSSNCRRGSATRKPTTTTPKPTTPKPVVTQQLMLEYLRDGKTSEFKKIAVKLKNWALYMPTQQSTTPQRTATSSNAVDGFDRTYSTTAWQKDPWWMVDMFYLIYIYGIVTNIEIGGQSLLIFRFTL